MTVLTRQECARFVDLKDSKTDTNLLTYHLKKLQEHAYIQKVEVGYTLGQNGFSYIQSLTKYEHQPDIRVMLLVQNSDGDVLLVKRTTQPHINTWTLPWKALEAGDRSLEHATLRIGTGSLDVRHVGDAYVRLISGSDVLSSTLCHVMRSESDSFAVEEEHQWVQPHRLSDVRLSPGIEQLITRSFFGDSFFFEEYDQPVIIMERKR
jgi:hypothetical protein